MGKPPLVLVTGTGTEVGKTWVAARLLHELRRGGLQVAARKPAQSHGPDDPSELFDAAVLAAASGEPVDDVCPPSRTYAVAMAPPMAAAALGRPGFTVAELVAGLGWARADGTQVDVGLVEAAGGVCSPQADDGDVVDLVRLLQPWAVVLVADAGLGTINAVRSTGNPLVRELGTAPAPAPARLIVVLNRFDPGSDLHRANQAWLAERDGFTVLTTPGEEPALAERVLGACGS